MQNYNVCSMFVVVTRQVLLCETNGYHRSMYLDDIMYPNNIVVPMYHNNFSSTNAPQLRYLLPRPRNASVVFIKDHCVCVCLAHRNDVTRAVTE